MRVFQSTISIFLLASFLITVAPCQAQLGKTLDAHGGEQAWAQYGAVEYDFTLEIGNSKRTDHQLVDLKERRVRASNNSYTAGFDGVQAWVAPNVDALDHNNPRFYLTSYYYYLLMPFVFSDAGTNVTAIEQGTLQGETYDRIKVTYGENVGESDDTYVGYIDPDTHRLRAIVFTVTYFENQDDPSTALVFEEWQKTGGLRVPKTGQYYSWTDEGLGKELGMVSYTNVEFRKERPPKVKFEKPAEGKYLPAEGE